MTPSFSSEPIPEVVAARPPRGDTARRSPTTEMKQALADAGA